MKQTVWAQFDNKVTLDFIITVCGQINGTLIDEETWEASGNPSPFD